MRDDPAGWGFPERVPLPPVEAPTDVPRSPDIKWREGLWTVVYHDDGSMGVCDWPIPGDRPDGTDV